jgi:hypothetical protein
MIQQSAGGTDKQINSLFELVALCFSVSATDQYTNCLIMKLTDLFGNLKHLYSQLPGGGNNNNSRAIFLFELEPIQHLNTWNEVGQRLARSCLCGT